MDIDAFYFHVRTNPKRLNPFTGVRQSLIQFDYQIFLHFFFSFFLFHRKERAHNDHNNNNLTEDDFQKMNEIKTNLFRSDLGISMETTFC